MFFLDKSNFFFNIPIIITNLYPYIKNNFLITNLIARNYNNFNYLLSDYHTDSFIKNWFYKSLFWLMLTQHNYIFAIQVPGGRFYQNEITFDGDTWAKQQLKPYTLTKQEQELVEVFYTILEMAKLSPNYNPKFNYGTKQIEFELNTYTKVGGKKVYDNPELNELLTLFKKALNEYYIEHIKDVLFAYEFLI